MRLLQWITHTRMSSRKNLLALPSKFRPIKLHLHQLVHILHDQHITIQLNHAIVFHQAERRQFRPAVVESRVGRIVFPSLGEQVLDFLRWNSTRGERSVAFGGKGIGIKCYEGIFRVVLFKGVVECEKSRKIFRICNESRPDYGN